MDSVEHSPLMFSVETKTSLPQLPAPELGGGQMGKALEDSYKELGRL